MESVSLRVGSSAGAQPSQSVTMISGNLRALDLVINHPAAEFGDVDPMFFSRLKTSFPDISTLRLEQTLNGLSLGKHAKVGGRVWADAAWMLAATPTGINVMAHSILVEEKVVAVTCGVKFHPEETFRRRKGKHTGVDQTFPQPREVNWHIGLSVSVLDTQREALQGFAVSMISSRLHARLLTILS